jgi:prepilin-type N-terminal cleavage/methylation domain-containing protein
MPAFRRRHGFALIEVVVAVLIIGISLLALLQIRNESMYKFIANGDQHTGAWLAELKMNELVAQDLPDPEDEETWELFGSGDFADYDIRVDELNRAVNPEWEDRYSFARFEYEWKKELVFIGPEFIGSKYELEEWEEPVDTFGEPTGIEDPRTKPAVRVVRVTLTVFMPEGLKPPESSATPTPNARRVQMVDGRPAIRLVTYVDPTILFNAAEDTVETDGGENNPGGNNSGNNNPGTNNPPGG